MIQSGDEDNAPPVPTQRMRRCIYFVIGLAMALGMVIVQMPAADDLNEGSKHPFRLAVSPSMFTEVNEADVRATMKVWILTVAKDLDIPVDSDPHIQPTLDALVEYGETHEVDGFAIVTPEFLRLKEHFSFDRFVTATKKGIVTEEYLLLVNRDSGLDRLDQLKGVGINVLNNPRMSLALIWLDTVLLEARLGRVSDFIGEVHLNKNASQVALPVFFRNSKICLMTRVSFEVMCELNPQLNKQLRILASSPPLVPSGFAFKEAVVSRFHGKIVQAMESLGNSTIGRQILDLIKADALMDLPITILEPSLDLLGKHQRLCGMKNTAGVDKPGNTQETPIR
jgi:hypothetical protein